RGRDRRRPRRVRRPSPAARPGAQAPRRGAAPRPPRGARGPPPPGPPDPARRPHGGSRPVVVGVRPEAFDAVAFAAPGARTFTIVPAVVEELGSDAHVFFHLDAEAVATDVTGRDEAALLPESKALYSARIDPRARARAAAPGGAEPVELPPGAGRLHFFDPETGRTLLPDRPDAQARAPELAE